MKFWLRDDTGYVETTASRTPFDERRGSAVFFNSEELEQDRLLVATTAEELDSLIKQLQKAREHLWGKRKR